MKNKIQSELGSSMPIASNTAHTNAINIMSEMILAYYSSRTKEDSDAKIK